MSKNESQFRIQHIDISQKNKIPLRWRYKVISDLDHDTTIMSQNAIPFLLEGVALDPSLNQQDGIHPNKEGIIKVSETIKKSIINIIN